MRIVEEIEQFIETVKDGRELKRALAVKMQLQGKPYQEIQNLLQVSQSFISQWIE